MWRCRVAHIPLSQSFFLSWLERERWQQFIMNLNKIADFNYFKEIYSDEFRPFDEVIIWRNVDRKVAQQ